MGTYKVPQNVEAEDKILGPLSLKQFIYAMIGVGYGLLTFAILNPISVVLWAIVGVPPMLALLGLGLYQREDQPLETFVVAMVEFFTRPHIRTWQKEPVAEVFRLEPPPPKPEMVVRDPTQVRSQLAQLADLVDTRGWSSKQPELQEPDEAPVIDLKDRLGGQGLDAQPVITRLPEVTEDDDILSTSNTSAQELNVLIENTVKSVREEALEKAKRAAAGKAPKTPAAKAQSISGSTAAPSGDILKLATEGGDLTVAQIAAQAHRHTNLTEGQTVSVRHAETS
jgi:hypothetical protein